LYLLYLVLRDEIENLLYQILNFEKGTRNKKGFLVIEREFSSLILTRFFEIENSRQCLDQTRGKEEKRKREKGEKGDKVKKEKREKKEKKEKRDKKDKKDKEKKKREKEKKEKKEKRRKKGIKRIKKG